MSTGGRFSGSLYLSLKLLVRRLMLKLDVRFAFLPLPLSCSFTKSSRLFIMPVGLRGGERPSCLEKLGGDEARSCCGLVGRGCVGGSVETGGGETGTGGGALGKAGASPSGEMEVSLSADGVEGKVVSMSRVRFCSTAGGGDEGASGWLISDEGSCSSWLDCLKLAAF